MEGLVFLNEWRNCEGVERIKWNVLKMIQWLGKKNKWKWDDKKGM